MSPYNASWLARAVLATLCLLLLSTTVLATLQSTNSTASHKFLVARSFGPTHLAKRQSDSSPACQKPTIRREWFTLTPEQRADWQRAFSCLSTPGQSQFLQGGSIMDDLAVLHIREQKIMHFNACFFPCHAALLRIFYHYMRGSCGYRGPETYVDFTAQAAQYNGLQNSPLWSPDNFGGDGRGGPIPDGPFKGLTGKVYMDLSNWSKAKYIPHLITRHFNNNWSHPTQVGDMYSSYITVNIVNRVLQQDTYDGFRHNAEYLLHASMHQAISGELLTMSAVYEPLFWLIHMWIDHLWRTWQLTKDPEYNTYSGPKGQVNKNGSGDGANGPEATVHDVIETLGLFEPIPVSDLMHPRKGIMCFKYDNYPYASPGSLPS